MDDLISRRDALDEFCSTCDRWDCDGKTCVRARWLRELPSIQPDDDRLERCRFEYANACKIVTHPTPDTTKKDIADAYAVVRALNPIFGEEGF